MLAVFKYYNFLNTNIDGLANLFHFENNIPYLQILLPIGLSFHTFQAMSYTIEVYRGNQKPEKHFGIYALYVMYYPQLVAGPIERPQNILHQFHEKKYFDYNRTIEGLKLMFFGFFKKIVIADRLALCANEVFNDVHSYQGGALILGIIFFTFQIYCDFSGYSDIAIGCSKIMGIDLMKNFNAPYLSKSIKEFWSRWHISLSTWFRDYLYIPLGGNKVSKPKVYRNIFIVFIVSGLWHGANWTFIIWGAIHGFFNIIGMMLRGDKKKKYQSGFLKQLNNFSSWAIAFLIVSIAWVFFRANSLSDAMYVLKNVLKIDIHHLIGIPIFSYAYFITSFIFIILLFMFEFLKDRKLVDTNLFSKPAYSLIYFVVFFIIIYVFGIFENQSFIYFQF